MSTQTTSTGRPTTQAAPRPANWQKRGKCGPGDAALFFPEKGTNEAYAHAQAKKICVRCPVREQCLSDALENWEVYGVRGGLTAKERQPMLGRDRLPARRHQGNPEPMWRQILRVPERREQLLELDGRGVPLGRIAAELHTNVQTVNRVLRELDVQAALDAASEAVAA
ncbi:WhiB family transcriptional regulator [Streptomyces sioyaensis]|uniref:WhiB family transcriptional regulator n=1 Tax=Streptomyces sioyaensis TaxID=67364 RepID=UPI00378B8B1F